MQIFINETSLCSQYACIHDFLDALKLFSSSLKKIGEIKNNKSVLRSQYFYYSKPLSDIYLESALKDNPELRHAFQQNLQVINPQYWDRSRCHEDNCRYDFSGNDYVNTSVAELAERKIRDRKLEGFLMNFANSPFGNLSDIEIIKDNKIKINVDCSTTPESIDDWLILRGIVNPCEKYDENSRIAPCDYQTVLYDSRLFEKTDYPRNNGRVVYRRIRTTELWCVDGAMRHAGAKAHIEVFNETTRDHLGTSLYNVVNLDVKHQVVGRKINLG